MSKRRPTPTGFRITRSKGFHVTFQNGYTVSVQFGPGNYGDNYNLSFEREAWPKEGLESSQAETAVWGPDGELIDIGTGDTVQGYRSPAQVLELLNWAAIQGATVQQSEHREKP